MPAYDYLLCRPCRIGPSSHPAAEQVGCSECGELCWRSPTSPSEIPVLCEDCVVDLLPESERPVGRALLQAERSRNTPRG